VKALGGLSWLVSHPAVGVYATPVLIAAGVYFAVVGPGWWEDFFLSHGLGFLISFWIGSGFAFAWWQLQKQAKDLPGGETMAGIAGIAGIVLVAGLSVFTEPWLFGVAIWPGLTMVTPAARRWLDEHLVNPHPGR
jgi:hypothetical protein